MIKLTGFIDRLTISSETKKSVKDDTKISAQAPGKQELTFLEVDKTQRIAGLGKKNSGKSWEIHKALALSTGSNFYRLENIKPQVPYYISSLNMRS